MQLVRCYNILDVQHQPFDDYRTPVSQTGVARGGAPCVVTCHSIRDPQKNAFCRQEFSLSNNLDLLNHFNSGDTNF